MAAFVRPGKRSRNLSSKGTAVEEKEGVNGNNEEDVDLLTAIENEDDDSTDAENDDDDEDDSEAESDEDDESGSDNEVMSGGSGNEDSGESDEQGENSDEDEGDDEDDDSNDDDQANVNESEVNGKNGNQIADSDSDSELSFEELSSGEETEDTGNNSTITDEQNQGSSNSKGGKGGQIKVKGGNKKQSPRKVDSVNGNNKANGQTNQGPTKSQPKVNKNKQDPRKEETQPISRPANKNSKKKKGPKKAGDQSTPAHILFRNALNASNKEDEYKSDSSDEEDIRNTVGNIPMKWYDEYPHLGYNWDGKKILKPAQGDELDNFLKRMEDPNFWRTVKDPQTGQDVILCDADLDLIQRLQKQQVPDATYDEYAPWVEWFSSEVMQMPIRKFPEHKRSFLPSKNEREKVGKIVHALKMGWIKPLREQQKKPKGPQFYMLWQTDDTAEDMRRITGHIPAPKRLLPGHAESYNPPPEYLFDEREMEDWKKLKDTPSKRKLHFVPKKYNSLLDVPAYPRYIRERFMRCMDLYLCPRARKLRLTIEPEDLVPQLPSPKDLQPFPTVQSMVYKGHSDMVRCITVEPKGQYLVSGSDDMTIKVWEISTGRCVRTIAVGGVVRSVSWCPNQALSLVAVAADRKVLLVNPGIGDHVISSKTDLLLEEAPEHDCISSDRVRNAVSWEKVEGENWKNGIRVILNHFKEVKQVTWHARGDYFATVMPDGHNRSVLIHQLSKRRSQLPFNKAKGLVQCVMFHPIRPFFFVATQKNVRIYDLTKQELVKKLVSNSRWISSMAIHPAGDNILVGTYDRKLLWFDLDLSTQPYQSLRLHGTAVRGVGYHKRYPLFASGSDDNNLIVSHGMVYNDLLQNPLIVPLKRLRDHLPHNDFGIFDVVFHPTQPWVFSSGSDSTIRLYT